MDTPNAPLMDNVLRIDIEDDRTLTIRMNPEFPDADFLLNLADGHAKIVAPEAVTVLGDLKEGPVIGTGPWILKSAQPDIGTIFEKNPDYFEEGLPFLDEFASRVVKSEEGALAAFLVGEVQVHRVTPNLWKEVKQDSRDMLSVVVGQGGTGLVLAMNVSRSPFDNITVRQAVLRAMDPWDYVFTIWEEQGYVSLGIPVTNPAWLLARNEMRPRYFADPVAARESLSTLNDGDALSFDLVVGDFGDIHRQQGFRMEQDLQAAGLSPRLIFLNPAQYAEQVVRDKAYQISLGVLPPTSGTTAFLLALLHSRGTWNLANHSDEMLNEMIESLIVQRDPAARGDGMRELQRYLLDQAYLFSPVTGATRWIMAPEVQGFFPTTAASEYFFWAKTWIER